jgi:hypothetical protein
MYLLLFKVTYAIPSVVILLLFLHYLQDNDVQEVEDEEENDQEQEANEARNVATSILDELLNRVVQTKAEVNSPTLL